MGDKKRKVIQQKVVQRNVGMYPDDWTEIDTLARAMKISSSGAMRMIVDFWRENRNPQDNIQMTRLRELAMAHYRGQIADDEFTAEAGILILAGSAQ